MKTWLDRRRAPLIGVGVALGLLAALGVVAVWTGPTRDSIRTYVRLLDAANRQDAEAARRLCSTRYARAHSLRPAPEGGLIGLPRNIHKNFHAWRDGPHIWFCPDRTGPVYQFVHESGAWRFDGPVGYLQGRHFSRFVAGDPSPFDSAPPDAD